MQLENEFRVEASVDRVWQVLTDLERIAPCMPGERPLPARAPPAVPAASVPANGDGEQVRRIESAPSPPVDLMGAAGVPVAKRVAPVVALLFVTMWLVRRRRRRRRARG